MTGAYDDEEERNLRRRMRTWDKRVRTLKDEMLVYIIQAATYELNKRGEKR